uniref:Uncharacterized protein n=3 Tax=Anopheles albimanus TaxID=7167 RepID=A0A182FXW6_ANOAL
LKIAYHDRTAVITRCFLEKLNWIYHNGTINPEGIERDMERRVYTSTRNDAKTTFDMKRAALQQCVAMLTEDNGEQPLPREPEDTAVLLYMCGSLGATVRCLRELQPISPICVRYRDLLELCIHDAANLAAFTNRTHALNGNT